MTIKFKKASQKELAKMNIDAEDFEAVETVEVNGQAVGAFVTTEEGWGCQYIDGKTGKALDFGDADYSDAKSKLRKMIKTIYADADTAANTSEPAQTSADENCRLKMIRSRHRPNLKKLARPSAGAMSSTRWH